MYGVEFELSQLVQGHPLDIDKTFEEVHEDIQDSIRITNWLTIIETRRQESLKRAFNLIDMDLDFVVQESPEAPSQTVLDEIQELFAASDFLEHAAHEAFVREKQPRINLLNAIFNRDITV